MENQSRKKSISLLLILFIVLLVAILVFLIVSIIKDNTSEEISGTNTENTSIPISIEANSNSTNDVEDIGDFNETTNEITNETENETVTDSNNEIINSQSEENNTVGTEPTNSEEKTLTLNNHTFKFDDSTDASIIQDSGKSVIQAVYSDYNYKMLLNTDNSMSFENLKNNSDLKTYLESNYNFSIGDTFKSGTLGNLDVILFTTSNGSNKAYCIITPLNDSEVLYAQIYNTTNMTTLVDTTVLSDSLGEISNVISNMQN